MKSTLTADIQSARAENKYVKCMPAPAARGKNSHFNFVQNTERALVVCGLYSGFVAAAALSAGLHQLFDGGLSRWALGLAFFGGMLAVANWRCARSILEQAERVSAIATDAATESTSRVFRNQTKPGR